MKAMLVKGERSKLHGAKCGLCPRPVRVGESVLYKDMPNSAYLERRLVFHTSCMADLVDRAPIGVPAERAERDAERIKAEILATGSLYGEAVA